MSELNDKAQRGVATIIEMLGSDPAYQLRDFAQSDRFGSAMSRLALEVCYADNWKEDVLSRREKSLILITLLVALRQPDELKNHVRLGLANGVTPQEIEELLLHVTPYVGFPATATASSAMRSMLREHNKKLKS